MSTPNDIRAKKPGKAKIKEFPTRAILVEDLRISMHLALATRINSDEEIVATRTALVKSIEECPGMWRTHVHVNKTDCHDIRRYIRIALK